MTFSLADERWDEMSRTMARQDKAIRDQQRRLADLTDQRDEYRDKYAAALQRQNDLKAKLAARSGISDAIRERLEVHRLKDKAKGLSFQLDALEELVKAIGGALRNGQKDSTVDFDAPRLAAQTRKANAIYKEALVKIAFGDQFARRVAEEALRAASR